MSLNNFIPSLWAAEIEHALQTALRYTQPNVVNRKYEGQIAEMGDSVRINMVGDPTITNYAKNTNMTDPETLNDGQSVLVIDQAKSFNFAVDDIDKAQAASDVRAEAMQRAAYGLAKAADQFMATKYTDISNVLGSSGAPYTLGIAAGDKNAYTALVDMAVALYENDVPENDRWVVVPPWVEGLLLKDDRFVRYGTQPQNDRLTNGLIGRVAGMDVLTSNNAPTSGSNYVCIAGHPMAWTFAAQINKIEAYRPEKRFADAVKGLFLYGGKVVRPNLMSVLWATKGTLS